MMGHNHTSFPLMHKYRITTRNLFCNFFNSMGNEDKDCHAFDLMRECTTDAYKVKGEESNGGILKHNNPRGYNKGGRGWFRGHGRGGFKSGRGPIICYNCDHPGHLKQDCLNPCMTYTYCKQLDHETKDCPHLIMKWK
jgi:hypothetical protein